MNCIQCSNELGSRATYCECGWRKSAPRFTEETNRFIQCAHETCGTSALHKIKVSTGYANVCQFHYDEHSKNYAEGALERHGMERKEGESKEAHIWRMRNYVQENVRKRSLNP